MLLLLGSGKTTVLVERIINKIINENVDIDKLLICTFTNAAAAEMRQRILDALYKKIDENPENENLQRQIVLLNKASISTIHAFCLEIIKNYFYEIDLPSSFRVGDVGEVELLKQESIDEVFDELYEEENESFLKLVNKFTTYRDDSRLKELILRIYNFSQSMPFPEDWLEENVEKFNIKDKLDEDFVSTKWGEILIEYYKQEIESYIREIDKAAQMLLIDEELEKYYLTLKGDIELLQPLLKLEKWDDICTYISKIEFEPWPRSTKIAGDLKDKAKLIRDNTTNRIKKANQKYFIYTSLEANQDIYDMYDEFKTIQEIVLKFSEKFSNNKREKNIIDFNDFEHFALNILLKKDETGKRVPTEIAKIYKQKFKEIAVDEYQDINLVQEKILNAISNDDNIFMVGDVKQSIYKFRGGRPELFLEKYDKYELAKDDDDKCKNDTIIQLFNNFRSTNTILDFTNLIFENIMSKKLGNIEYNEKEYLNPPVKEDDSNKNIGEKIEIDIIDLLKQEDLDKDEDEEDEIEEVLEKEEIEAKFVADRINKLMKEDIYINDKKEGLRKLKFRDIVILLRTTKNIASIYEKELSKQEIPVYSDTSTSYFETDEIQTILSVLKIIDNPNNDIPLVTVLRSQIGGFTDNELIEIRLKSKDTSFYNAILNYVETEEDTVLKEKVISFLSMLEDLQIKQEYLSLDKLIWYLYESTGFYDYISTSKNGELKTLNLKLLFEKAKDYEEASFKGLYNFINYIEKISGKTIGDSTSAKVVGENEDVVRIMSIHKSKGLEFPVVFLSGTGKQFNLQDLNENILLHQDYGFGPKITDFERKIEYNTLAKEAIRIELLNENISEEMRLLYVALTRAREKLIITGVDKNLEESTKAKREEISDTHGKIQTSIIRKEKSYLSWIELLLNKEPEKLKSLVVVNKYNKDEISDEKKEKETILINDKLKEFIENKNDEEKIMVDSILSWKYSYQDAVKLEGKKSVTEIAHNNSVEKKIADEIKTPKFIKENDDIELTGAQIGTLMHLVMQKLDFRKDYTKDSIELYLDELVSKSIISDIEKKHIKVDKILRFFESNLYKDIKDAKIIKKEEPFYIYLDSDKVFDTKEKEKVLVQGIIDLYYINKKDELVLVDYKTDFVENENELKDKYKKQLEIYKEALEKSLDRKVNTIYIYSLFLGKEIEI